MFSGGRKSNKKRSHHDLRGKRSHERKVFRDELVVDSEQGSSHGIPHPQGLYGRQIGMYYRNLQKEKKIKPKEIPIRVAQEIICDISHRLASIRVPDIRAPFKMFEESPSTYDHIQDSYFKRKFINTISTTFEEQLENIEQDKVFVTEIPELNVKLKNQHEKLEKLPPTNPYKQLLETRQKLPAFKHRQQILDCLETNQVVVISGETGCGKTTQVPQFILDHYISQGRGSACKIICTQPRRISAISVAERVAAEKNSAVGKGYTGYSIRLESKLPRKKGSILFCTTGVLLQQMQTNFDLDEISHLIMDEIHERDVLTDILLTIIKQLITKRKDLKVILMSATLNAEVFSKYFNNCACLHIPGFTFPVEELFLEDILHKVPYELDDVMNNAYRRGEETNVDKNFIDYVIPHVRELRNQKRISDRIASILSNPHSEKLSIDLVFEVTVYIVNMQPPGAILIFLPGISQISALIRIMEEEFYRFYENQVNIIPLHSKLATFEQKAIFEPSPAGVRKIIVATNIAETSITIDDVVYVINPGQIKLRRYDPVKDLDSLEPEWVTRANSSQRRGRAGRVKPGVCYHLFTKARHEIMDMNPIPEILRTRLDEVILQLKLLLVQNAEAFLKTSLSQPDPLSVTKSLYLLRRLNAIDSNEKLTPLGYHLARLPMDPRSGKMILLGALFSCLDPVLSITASLSFKDPFNIPIANLKKKVLQVKTKLSHGSKSDHLVIAEALKKWENTPSYNRRKYCSEHFLNAMTMQLLSNMKQQFADYLCELNFLPQASPNDPRFNMNSNNTSLLRAIICAGLFPNVARILNNNKNVKNPAQIQIRTGENETVKISQQSVNSNEMYFDAPFLVYFTKMKSSNIFIHDSTMAHSLPIVFFADNIDYSLEKLEEENDRPPEMILKLNDLIQWKCSIRVAELIKKISEQWNDLLEYKVSHPGFVDWSDQHNYQVAILSIIMRMITLEDKGSLEYND